jgi:hypothetical protein
MSLSAIVLGLAGAVTLTIGFSALWPPNGVISDLWDLAGVAGVMAFIGLLEGA